MIKPDASRRTMRTLLTGVALALTKPGSLITVGGTCPRLRVHSKSSSGSAPSSSSLC